MVTKRCRDGPESGGIELGKKVLQILGKAFKVKGKEGREDGTCW
jgi:hypothetical protein